MFRKLVNYFIPATINNNPVELRLARILVIVFLITGIFDLVGISSAIAIKFQYSAYLLFISGVASFLLAFLFKNGLSFRISATLFFSIGFIQIFLQAWYGGGLESPSAVALFLIPAIAMLLVGRKGATFWLILAVSVIFFMFWYEGKFGQLPEMYDISMRTNFEINGIIGMMLCIFVIILVIDSEKNEAYQKLFITNKELKASQNQLIQSEKLASLAELTSGIAHEIQNPLNFVNNFSELSSDITKDLHYEINKPIIDKKYVSDLLSDLSSNHEKISHHGKRASSIVKSMLEHSRASSGKKELIDLNDLADEYFRLSYHGLRSKDKNFNVSMETHFDTNLPLIEIIPQEIGRVFLNLINNAFYAVNEKKKRDELPTNPENQQGKLIKYAPTVKVSTRKLENSVEVIIKDNGTGIPKSIKEKIFQPFYTTKPTGQGVGLGLSLAYEIITKGHGGSLKVESTEGEGSEFIINLPTTK